MTFEETAFVYDKAIDWLQFGKVMDETRATQTLQMIDAMKREIERLQKELIAKSEWVEACNDSLEEVNDHRKDLTRHNIDIQSRLEQAEEILRFYGVDAQLHEYVEDSGKRARAHFSQKTEQAKIGQSVCEHGNSEPLTCRMCNKTEQAKDGGTSE